MGLSLVTLINKRGYILIKSITSHINEKLNYLQYLILHVELI